MRKFPSFGKCHLVHCVADPCSEAHTYIHVTAVLGSIQKGHFALHALRPFDDLQGGPRELAAGGSLREFIVFKLLILKLFRGCGSEVPVLVAGL